MIWLRLVWWTLWRGLLYGGITGIVFGTLVSPYDGTIYGVLIGTIMGAALGLLNGISLAVMTRLFFYPLLDRSRYSRWLLITMIPLDLIITLACVSLTGIIGLVAAFITAIIAYLMNAGFADYVSAQFARAPSQPPAARALS